jgi:hydrogenase maturation protease
MRGDDAFGREVAERLQETIRDPAIEILALHQLTPELMEPVSRAGRVLFIDARDGAEPGEISIEPLEPRSESGAGFTHLATPSGLLEGARSLYGSCPPAALLTAGAAGFELGAGLSIPVRQALQEAVERAVPNWIREG